MMMKKVMLATLSGVSNVGQLTTRQRTKGREGKVSERLPACHADKNTKTKTIAKKYKQIQIYTFIHLQLKGMIWVQWDLHGGFKMKAVGPQRIQKCSQNSISPKKENANKFLRFSLCNICLNNCVCLSRRNGKNAPGWCATLFSGR